MPFRTIHPHPSLPGPPTAARSGGPRTTRLQPVLVLAPRGALAVRAHRPPASGSATAARSPCCEPRATGPRCSTTRTSWSSTRPSCADFDTYMANGREHWYARHHGTRLDGPVAYFCAEYGLQESLPIYSGGLGVLAGDHCKAASDMALPFVAVGLFYRRGYFRQTIDADGHQEHGYLNLDPERLPLLRRRRPAGRAADGRRGAARTHRARRRVAGPGRPRAAAAARHRHARER